MESRRDCDHVLLIVTLFLVALGIGMVYSASSIMAQERFGDGYYFLTRQAAFAALGLVLMLLLLKGNYRWLRPLALPGAALALLLLVAVLLPQVGVRVGGVRRWMGLGGITFQPSELAKLALIIYMAHRLAKMSDKVVEFARGFLPLLLLALVMGGLVVLEPDLGSATLLVLLAMVLLFLGGARLSHLGLTVLAALPSLYLFIQGAAYRRARILAFLNPWDDPQGSGFQIIQSYLAIGSGGLFGLGLGNGRQKLFYLPEAHTDFMAAVIGEELGLVGFTLVILAFGLIAVRGFAIAMKSPDPFGYYLGLGLTSLISLQAAINLGVVTGLAIGLVSLVFFVWRALTSASFDYSPEVPRFEHGTNKVPGAPRASRERGGTHRVD